MHPLLLALILLIFIMTLRYLFNSKRSTISKPSTIPFENRDYIEYNDLLDKRIRANPHKFNQHIYNNIISKSNNKAIKNGIIPVRGEKNAFLICKYKQIREILTNEKIYSSNPFPDERLIAPNAMDDKPHRVIMKYLRQYYSPSTVTKQIPTIQKIITKLTENFIHRQRIHKQINNKIQKHKKTDIKPEFKGNDIMNGLCKLIVMKVALFMLGISSKKQNNFKLINSLIKYNDAMVRLVAPQGAIGHKIHFSFTQLFKVFLGLIIALIPTLKLIYKIGIKNVWNLMRPDLNVFKLPNVKRDNGTPRTQMWVYPNILYTVPEYFLLLNELYVTYGINSKYPNVNRETNLIKGKNVLQSFYDAEKKGDMTRAEIIVSIVQLMVNMTTANAIGNMLYRMAKDENGFILKEYLCIDGVYDENKGYKLIEEVMRLDASLQRLPRRCRMNINDFYGEKFPKNSNIICMIGLGNCDKDKFGDNGFEFIPDRYNDENIAKSLSFGYGIHLCIGYNLVKREMNLLLKSLVECGVKKISYKSCERVVDIDVGNYGFNKLFVELIE
eukprot:331912_1